MEDIYPQIRQMEYEFYQRRTEGCKLEWLGPGYRSAEKTRFDEFIHPYMGKDYGNTPESGYELLSMGMEGLFAGSFDIFKDPDYADFILGLLASID
jgi:hypothetical protein